MVRMTIDGQAQVPAADQASSDPFDVRVEVPVAGGALNVAYAGPAPHDAEAVVLAVHGVTASHMTWRTVARHLCARSGTCLIAPDLRGRGRSASLAGPYGLASHVRDLTLVLDHVGVERAVMVGHSMGAHLAARLSVEQPERAAGLVLVDGGLPRAAPIDGSGGEDADADADQDAARTPGRMEGPCASADAYLAGWRAHPAFERAWDGDVESYVRYDMADDGRGVRCVVSQDAVMADSFDLLFDGVTRTAITRVCAPLRLLRAPRGPLDDHRPVIPRQYLDAFTADHPHLDVEDVPDTNHYTIVMGNSPGPARVATAIQAAIGDGDGSRAD